MDGKSNVTVDWGRAPLVAGTMTRPETLFGLGADISFDCDLVEVRLDLVGPDAGDWLAACQAIEEGGTPVLLTLRLAEEGGKWARPDAERRSMLAQAQDSLALLDVEHRSPLWGEFCERAGRLARRVIVSFHDFDGTPPLAHLQAVVDEIRRLPNAIPKIVGMVQSEQDVDTLRTLLAHNRNAPICVLGMGDLGQSTRVEFPRSGSCLTYGFIDASSAPGQLTAGQLREALRSAQGGSATSAGPSSWRHGRD